MTTVTITDEMVKHCPCCGNDLSNCAAIKLYSDEMVERAAEAMCNEAEHVKPPGTVWGLKSLERRAMYRRYARAALAAALSGKEE